MNIQLSVTVWTVICFVALMLILHNLLFKPVLRVMDERRERIDRAKGKREELNRRQSEYDTFCAQRKEDFIESEKRRIKDELESIRKSGKKDIEKAREERLVLVDEFRLKTEEEHGEILETLKGHSEMLAEIFAQSIIKE